MRRGPRLGLRLRLGLGQRLGLSSAQHVQPRYAEDGRSVGGVEVAAKHALVEPLHIHSMCMPVAALHIHSMSSVPCPVVCTMAATDIA